jgi:hypothetical protein
MDVGVANDLHGSFARISAIRDRQTQTRIARSEQLARLVAYFRATLVEYLTRTDPITGARLVDIGVDESKAHGGFSVVLALFDGSKLKIAVDALGRYSHASVPDIFAQIGRIVEVRVLDDFTRADICYLAPGDSRGPIRIEPVDTFLLAIRRTVGSGSAAAAHPGAADGCDHTLQRKGGAPVVAGRYRLAAAERRKTWSKR